MHNTRSRGLPLLEPLSPRELRRIIRERNMVDSDNEEEQQRAPEVVTFSTNPYSADINPSTKHCSTLYLNATKAVEVDSKLDLSLKQQQAILEELRKIQSKFGWGKVTSKVPASDANNAPQYDVLLDINKLSVTLVREYTNSIFHRRNSRVLPTGSNPIAFEIDPQAEENDRPIFYNRVRCTMIGEYLLGLFKPKALLKITQKKHLYTWRTTDGEVLYDGVLMLQFIMDIINPSTKVGVSGLKDQLRNAKLSNHQNNVASLTEHMENTYQEIISRGSTHEDYTKDLFDALGSGKNDEFNSFISTKKTQWETGTTIDSNQLITDAITIYNNLYVKNLWNAKSKADDKLVALTTQVSKLKDELSKVKGGKNDSDKGGEKKIKLGKYYVDAWRVNRGDKSKSTLKKHGKTWFWDEKKNNNQGLWTTKKPDDSKSTDKSSDKSGSNKSLTLNDKMKAAMVTRFKCSDDEASQLWSEVCDQQEEDF